MKRLFCVAVAIVAVLSLAAQYCWSLEPETPPLWESCWNWGNPVCDGTKVFVCPCGGGSYIYAHIIGKYHIPEVGAIVTATFQATPGVSLCKAVSGVADANGDAILHVCAGLNVTGGRACVTVTTTVKATIPTTGYYEIIRWCPTCPNGDPVDLTCAGVDEREWLSADMNGDLAVNSLDYAIFASDWQSDACRSDYNCDGHVNSLDGALLAPHWGDNCSDCP